MKKLSEYNFTHEQICTFYEQNKGPINNFYGEDEDADILSEEKYEKHIAPLVKSELARIQDFNETYPFLTKLLRKGFQPSLQYILDRDDEYPFFDEDGYMKADLATVLGAAKTNVGLLKCLPEHYRSDPTVLLTAYFSNRNSFMGLNAYFEDDAFNFVSQDLWDGNCYDIDHLPALNELLNLVRSKFE